MRKMIRNLAARIVFAVASSLAVSSCDSGTLWEDEKYAVYWIDSPDNIELGIKVDDSSFIGRGRPISVGSDERYLVVRKELGYFYVIKSEDDWKNDHRPGQHGPYTLEEFNEIKKQLKLPEFEKEF
jgi:hypothetical protein